MFHYLNTVIINYAIADIIYITLLQQNH